MSTTRPGKLYDVNGQIITKSEKNILRRVLKQIRKKSNRTIRHNLSKQGNRLLGSRRQGEYRP